MSVLNAVQEGMLVYGSDQQHVGAVDAVEADGIRVQGRTIPGSDIDRIVKRSIYLSRPAAEYPAVALQRHVVGVFDRRQAEQVLTELRESGFAPDQVSVVAQDTGEAQTMIEETGMGEEVAAAGTGAAVGGLAGGVAGWLVGIGALAIPGLGPIMAAGALATTLGGAALGAAAGGLIGALVAMGIPEEEARGYEASVRGGSVLLTVTASREEQVREARRIFARFGGGDVRVYETGAGGSGQSATA